MQARLHFSLLAIPSSMLIGIIALPIMIVPIQITYRKNGCEALTIGVFLFQYVHTVKPIEKIQIRAIIM